MEQQNRSPRTVLWSVIKWKSWFLNTEVVRKLTLEIVISAVVSGDKSDNMTGTPSPSAKIRGGGFLGSQFLVIRGPFFEMVENCVSLLKERSGIDLPSWISLQYLSCCCCLDLIDWILLSCRELSVHEKGVKGVELGKCSLLSEKTLTRGTPSPLFRKLGS